MVSLTVSYTNKDPRVSYYKYGNFLGLFRHPVTVFTYPEKNAEKR